MVTTIQSTALDFNTIKNNLKTYLAARDEFRDYNFEASGLSNILDVLAYNTHINALIANFALNESYLSTAQLRSSIVSLAEGIGYIPDTDTASQAKIRVSLSSSAASRAAIIELPPGTRFTSVVDDITYTFRTLEAYFASDDGTGFYQFRTNTGSTEIPIYEGTLKTKTFIVGEYADNPTYIIPDNKLDADTVTVKVYPNASSTTFTTFQNILTATTISASSTVYILKEAPNGFFELSFGDGETFGIAPTAGNRIVIEYLSVTGADANGASIFNPVAQYPDPIALAGRVLSNNVSGVDLNTTTVVRSIGGREKETIESIRKNAPFQYAAQNRMVTAADYSSLILRNYSTLIKDIKAWGGEDNLDPEFGAVYVSILFEDDVTLETQATTKLSILDLAAQLAIISFRLRFTDPERTYIEVANFFQFNPNLTTLTLNTIQNQVAASISTYMTSTLGGFDKSFRRSNMLTQVDDVSAAVLSSRAHIRMQKRFIPTTPSLITTIRALTNNTIPDSDLNRAVVLVTSGKYDDAATIVANYATSNFTAIRTSLASISVENAVTLRYPAPIATVDGDENFRYIITSTPFTYNGRNCIIRSELNSTNLQIIAVNDESVVVNSIGSFVPATGVVRINYFTPSAISGGVNFIKLSATPANQSAITPTLNNILEYDPSVSYARAVLTTATN